MTLFLTDTVTQQPKLPIGIDWGNPITRDLRMAVMPHVPVNIVDNVCFKTARVGTFTVSGRDNEMCIGSGWMEYGYPASSTALEAVLFDLSVLTAVVVTRQDIPENANFAFLRSDTSSAPSWGVGVHGGTNNGPYTKLGTYSFTPSTTGESVTRKRVVGLRGDGTTASTWFDGRLYDSGTYTPPTYSYNGTSRCVRLTTLGLTGGQQENHPSLGLFWGRSLSDAEMSSISENPWQVFAPSRRLFIPSDIIAQSYLNRMYGPDAQRVNPLIRM